MSFLWPAGLGFLALIPAVALLYFLRLHRRPRAVSSTFLWKRTVDAFRVNRPFQKFTNHLLLWLQLLAVALLALAAARPSIETRQDLSGVHIVLIDHSASMAVRENGSTRLAQAQEFLRAMIRGKRASDRMMVIGFSDRAHVASSLTSDRDALLSGVDQIHPTHRPTRIDEAWTTALSVARQFDVSDVYLLSDGGFRALPKLTEAHANVHYVPFGSSSDNVGIVHLETRSGEDARDRVEVFARLANHRAEAVEVLVELLLNDRLADAQTATLAARSERGIIFQRPFTDEGVAELRLAVEDGLAADDRAWIRLGASDTLRATLVGDENPFLRQAIAMDPRVELTVVPAKDYAALRDQLGDADLTVFDGVDPGPLERGTFLLIGPPPPLEGFLPGPEVEHPTLVTWDDQHPLTRYINFSTLHVARAVPARQPIWMKPLLVSDAGPLISAGERGRVRLATVAFRLGQSDWPLRVSFPLFFANALRWAREEDVEGAGFVRPGEPLRIRAPRDATSGTLTLPHGVTTPIQAGPTGQAHFSGTDLPGVYRAQWTQRAEPIRYAVSLLDPAESDIRVPETISVGDAAVAARLGSAEVRRELTLWLLAAAAAVLLAEWLAYQFMRS